MTAMGIQAANMNIQIRPGIIAQVGGCLQLLTYLQAVPSNRHFISGENAGSHRCPSHHHFPSGENDAP
ncbi:hypothetical protein GA0111570_1228 [Raineyella antarctica]|uniref:Uncharacterized protein n=1 Tax=Raineyella antarctica TaxID=1577474 RepID=A0A1G6ITM5_9ACTN|nr:hypothetical protein GA0111570_1228 [Raineyella antarctica]